jgi:hypothetical protein
MRRRHRQQPPDTDRGEAGGERIDGWTWSWTWIWRGRHGKNTTLTRRCPRASVGDDREANDAAGACAVSQKRKGNVMNTQ